VIENHAAKAETQRQKLEFIAARFRRLMLGFGRVERRRPQIENIAGRPLLNLQVEL
jgi:hypothetical protein